LRQFAGWAAARCCTAGRCAPGLLACGRLRGTGKAGIRPGEPAIGIVAAVEPTSCKVPADMGAVPGSAIGTTTASAR
jgi:hypothetical protein